MTQAERNRKMAVRYANRVCIPESSSWTYAVRDYLAGLRAGHKDKQRSKR